MNRFSLVRSTVAGVLLAAFGTVAMAQAGAASAPAAAPATAPAQPDTKAKAAPSGDVQEGKLAWYGAKFNGRRTASGERYNAAALTMAHQNLPFGTRVRVTNLANKKSVMLRVNDRGPKAGDRLGDVSQAAATRLGMRRVGLIDAKLEVVGAAAKR